MDKTNLQTCLISFSGGKMAPKAPCVFYCKIHLFDYIVQPLLWSIKLQCTMVTKRTVNHLKPKNKNTKNCPHHSEYDTLDISLLIINISTITHYFQWSIWQTLKVKWQQNLNKTLILIMAKNVCIKDKLRNLLEECYCTSLWNMTFKARCNYSTIQYLES